MFVFVTVLPANPCLCSEINWQEKATTHFIIYYQKQIAQDYIDEVAARAEEYYDSIAANLSFVRYESWSWDNRAKIYIFNDAEEYREESAKPRWSGGSVSLRRKIIKTYPWAEGFLDNLLPHELGHIMFHELVGFRNNVPLWLDEGVAILQEKSDIKSNSIVMKRLLKTTAPIPIEKLNVITTRTLIVPEVFYAQSASIVDFLLSNFEKKYFVKLCKSLRSGRSLSSALKDAYHFRDFKELSDAWLEYLKNLEDSE